MTIPVVDLSPYFSSRIKSDDLDALAGQWDRAMSKFGFAIVVGHPVPHQQVSTLHAAIRKFFESTPSELKQSFEHGPYGSPGGGYKGLGYESVGTTWKLGTVGADNDNKKRVAAADIVENYVFRGLPASWKEREPAKAHPVELERLAGPYVARVLEISNVIHRLSARALGVEDLFFDQYFDSTPETEYSLRLAYYPPTAEHSLESDSIRYGAHTDYTGYTILYQDPDDQGNSNSGGLQVLVDGHWQYVQHVENGFVVNAGDLWPIWSNGRWISAVHRVTNPAKNSEYSHQSRVSIPFFTGPRGDTVVEPIVINGDKPKFQAVEASQHLQPKVKASNT